MEEWRDVVGYESYFRVSNHGKIFSKRTNKILKTHVHKSGYVIFSTRFDGKNSKATCFKVHRLIATAFLDNPYKKPVVNHIDGNKQNNHVDNLEWVTYSENLIHAYSTGLSKPKKGDNNPQAKLTMIQVKEIRSRYKPRCKVDGQRALGREFGVNKNTIRDVIEGRSYVE